MEKPHTFRLKAEALRPLVVRSDAAGVRRAAGHFGAIAVTAGALWYALGTLWAIPLTVLLGYMLAFLFNPLHETAHQTAFKTRPLNYVVGHVSAWLLLLPYEYYRAYHWEHHRHTQDPEKDPELLSMPYPNSRFMFLIGMTGVLSWPARIRLLFTHAFLGRVKVPWIPADKHATVVREARCYLAAYALAIALSVAAQSMILVWLWVVPIMVGQLFIRPYLLAEHTGCEHSPNMLTNTRTTYTNAWVRFFAWNMPYHVEHHAYPAVPFHALPRLNTELAAHIANTAQGYPAAVASATRYLNDRIDQNARAVKA